MPGRTASLWACVTLLAWGGPIATAQSWPPPSTWVPAGTSGPAPAAVPPGAVPAAAPPAMPGASVALAAPAPAASPLQYLPVTAYQVSPDPAAPPVPPGSPAPPPGYACPPPTPAPYACPPPALPAYGYPAPVCPPPYALVPAPRAPVARSLAEATDGVFVNLELFVAQPTIKIQPESPPDFSAVPPRSLPLAQPETYVSPLVELGYRFSGGQPYLAFGYRYLASDGQATPTNAAGVPYSLTSEFRVHQFTLDLGGGSTPPPTDLALSESSWTFGWRVGVQVNNISVDSGVQRDRYTSSIDNEYWGVGPRGRLEAEYRFDFAPEVSAFGRVDGALLFGRGSRTSEVSFPDSGGATQTASLSYAAAKPAPVLMLVFGLGYRPEALPDLRLGAGYVYQHWWSMGLVSKGDNTVGVGTKGEASSHGLFLQLRYDF